MFLRLAAFLILAVPAAAQIDLPDRPVRPPPVSRPVEVPAPPRGNLAERMTGAKAAEEARQAAVDLPSTALPRPTPSESVPSASETPGGALAAAARFILAEVARAQPGDQSLVTQAVHSLSSLGEAGLQAAREALASEQPSVLEVAVRVLLSSGSAADAERVQLLVRGRLPKAACAPLVAALAEVDPVRASPEFLVELLGHGQVQVRAAAQRELSRLPPAALVAALPEAFAARTTDTRLRAVALLAGSADPGATRLLVECLGDRSAEVGRKALEALAARQDESVAPLLLQRAFDGRWVLRENAYALLALIEREDVRVEALLGAEHVDALLGGLGSSDVFVAGSCASALAGIGFRSPTGAPTAWIDDEVPARLVRCLSGVDFHNDISALQPAALRRLSLISGQHLGTEGARWVEWWSGVREEFHALRAVLSASPEEASALRVDCLDSGSEPHAFRLLGPAVAAATDRSELDSSLILSEVQAGELLELLRREQIFDADRLPGTRAGYPGSDLRTRTLEVSLGGGSKVFTFAGGASEPWFERAVEGSRALFERNRWQLYLTPGLEQSPRDAYEREGAWWSAERSPLERDQRFKERIFSALRAQPVSERDAGLAELERMSNLEGRFSLADLVPLREFLVQERFLARRARTLLALCRIAAGLDQAGYLPAAIGADLVSDLETTFGESAALEIQETLRAMGPAAVRAAVADERNGVRALVPQLLAEHGDPESTALLVALLDDGTPGVEAAAVIALGQARVESVRDEILIRARVAEPLVRSAALVALGRLGGAGALDALLIGLSEREAPEICVSAARGLAALADPSTAALFVSMLSQGGDDLLLEPAREGLLSLGPAAWPDLLRVVRTPGHRSRREAALLLSRQAVPEAAPALIAHLADEPDDPRVAAELCVLSGVDLREESDPARAWWDWWSGVVHDDATAWFLGALARGGQTVPPSSSLAEQGTAEGARFLVGVLAEAPTYHAERARRELSRLLGRELAVPPAAGVERHEWLRELSDELARRYN